MDQTPASELLTGTTFSVEQTGNSFVATADLPETAPFDELVKESHHPEYVLKELYEGVTILAKHGDVHAVIDERGKAAAAAAMNAPGVVDVRYYESTQSLQVMHETLQTDTYDDVVHFGGLKEDGWWVDVDREHGLVLVVEYTVDQFAPPIPERYSWADIQEGMRDRDPEQVLIDSFSFDHLFALYEEFQEFGTDQFLISRPDIRDGEVRLAGTTHSAFHAYYLIEVKNGDIEMIRDRHFPDLTISDLEFMIRCVTEECRDEAEQYARKKAAVTSQNDEIPLEEIPDWVPPEERNYEMGESSAFKQLGRDKDDESTDNNETTTDEEGASTGGS